MITSAASSPRASSASTVWLRPIRSMPCGCADACAHVLKSDTSSSVPSAASGVNGQSKDGEKRDASGLTEAERDQVKELKKRDTEVRNHERAHQAAGGQYAGSPSYTYQTGPDGRRYAIGGEVSIDISPERDPAATIAKMERIRGAATAPAEPSPQDYKVAAAADKARMEAQRELNAQTLEKLQGGGEAEEGGEGSASDGKAQSFGRTGSGLRPPGQTEQEQAGQEQGLPAQDGGLVASAARAYRSASALGRPAGGLVGINA
ncbi:putative metalloprotease CJM1_0395 family protein [Skermanella pratensis]|uniref:putative metalloprotease CJM1_0395 family protein n=1 Tax=Skermanella pratensis TaxID=2233999 RepID=UPI00130111B5|nr:putative metalloprotease CJM1_0395 family protein [Skermanella pratensis]